MPWLSLLWGLQPYAASTSVVSDWELRSHIS